MADTSRYKGAILGSAVGDALGRPTENRSRVAATNFYVAGLVMPDEGRYSDDTEMALAVGESLVAHGYVNKGDLATRFVRGRSPKRGYGTSMEVLLEQCADGDELIRMILSGTKDRASCGAAMRVHPLGVVFADDPAELRRSALTQAHVTHYNIDASLGAVCVAEAMGKVMRGDSVEPSRYLAELAAVMDGYSSCWGKNIRLLEEALSMSPAAFVRSVNPENPDFGIPVGAEPVAMAALWAFLRSPDDFQKTAHTAVTLGGDTDSVAAIACALSGGRNGIGSIPDGMLVRLEGRERLERLAIGLEGISCRASDAFYQRAVVEERTRDCAREADRILGFVSRHIGTGGHGAGFDAAGKSKIRDALSFAMDYCRAAAITPEHSSIKSFLDGLSAEGNDAGIKEGTFWSHVVEHVADIVRARDAALCKAVALQSRGVCLDEKCVSALKASCLNGLTYMDQAEADRLNKSYFSTRN